ncbi:MAG TPA: peroxiredoxin [Verrucomicrobiae bacterium]|nr:peroxiredoxin [Verrucomicrobiae bacterium]
MKRILSVFAVWSFCSITAVFAAMPRVGDTAPTFVGKNQDGKNFNLSELIGKKIVLLYFYPKDFTGGCTKEACGFRDRMGDLQKDNVQVVGVSFDTEASHQKFIATYNLNFPLIADPEGKIADLYGVRMEGRNLDNRVSFLIDLDGKIVHVTNSGNPQVHFSEMKDAIAGLKKG